MVKILKSLTLLLNKDMERSGAQTHVYTIGEDESHYSQVQEGSEVPRAFQNFIQERNFNASNVIFF